MILFFIWRLSCPERRGHGRWMGDIKILHLLLDILYNNILNTVQDFARSHGGSEAGRAYLKVDIDKRAFCTWHCGITHHAAIEVSWQRSRAGLINLNIE